MKTIKNSWSLISFARSHGKMAIGNCKSGDGTTFKGIAFTSGNDRTFCFFSRSLGELTPSEIINRKDCLQVVEQYDSEDGKTRLYLCNQGESSWEDVDLGL